MPLQLHRPLCFYVEVCSSYTLVLISININGLNSPIKGHRLTDWILKQDPTLCCIQETHLSDKDWHYLRLKGWKTIFQANGPKNQARVAILILNKINFQPKVIKKDKEGHFILMKGKIYQEELSILNLWSKCKGMDIHKINFLKAQSTHHILHNNSGRHQHSTVPMDITYLLLLANYD